MYTIKIFTFERENREEVVVWSGGANHLEKSNFFYRQLRQVFSAKGLRWWRCSKYVSQSWTFRVQRYWVIYFTTIKLVISDRWSVTSFLRNWQWRTRQSRYYWWGRWRRWDICWSNGERWHCRARAITFWSSVLSTLTHVKFELGCIWTIAIYILQFVYADIRIFKSGRQVLYKRRLCESY